MTEPLSADLLSKMRTGHRDTGDGICGRCSRWIGVPFPCEAALLLAELDRREAQDRWPGRNHVSPWARRVER